MSDLPLDETALDCAVAAHANETVLVMLGRRTEEEAMATAISTYLRKAGFKIQTNPNNINYGNPYLHFQRQIGPWEQMPVVQAESEEE